MKKIISIIIAGALIFSGLGAVIAISDQNNTKSDSTEERHITDSFDDYSVAVYQAELGEYSYNPMTRNTVYVDDDADPGWYDATHVKTIQEGINNASAGDMVYVYNGAYFEHVTIGKSLDLTGENKEETIIDGGGSGNVVYVTAHYVNISAFTIRNGSKGIYVSSYNNISGNIVINNSNRGIYLWSSRNYNIISENVIINNEYVGIQLHTSCNNNIIYGNTISGHRQGIKLYDSSTNDIYENVITDSEWGIDSAESSDNIMFGNSIAHNDYGILLGRSSNNDVFDNNITDNVEKGIWVMDLSYDNNIYHNNFVNNTVNAYDECSNDWNNDYPSGGNYWDNHHEFDLYQGENQDVPGGDGIVDQGPPSGGLNPYYIPGGSNQDTYPWMYPDGAGTSLIYVPFTSHDYGLVIVGNSSTWNATVINIGTVEDLEIHDISFTGSDFMSCPLVFPVTINPGNQLEIPLVYTPLDDTPLDATATIESSDPVCPEVYITLTGESQYPGSDIYVPVDTHDYGSVRTNSYNRWFMEIQNVGNEPLIISSIDSDDSQFAADPTLTYPFTVEVLSSVDVAVWFRPEAGVGCSATLSIYSNTYDPDENPYEVFVQGTGIDTEYPIGQTLWECQITGGYDNSPKAIAPIKDINGDGVDDVIICSEDHYVRCLNGNAHAQAEVLWEHEIYCVWDYTYYGSVFSQKGLAITEDVDDDGYNDVVIGSAWGARLIRTISGKTGEGIWTHDTREYGDGGWVYQVDCSYDYNNDGIIDVLAATGDDSSDTGPKRIYCLDGLTGVSIWERFVGGPAFSVIGIEDVTGDGQPDVVAGPSDEWETTGYAYGINGANGNIIWTFETDGTSVWALAQIDDISNDGIKDVIVADFVGNIYGLNATNGAEVWSNNLGYVIITQFEKLDDVNGDGHPDILPAILPYGSGHTTFLIDGFTGQFIWTQYVADKPSVVSRISDITGDGINDVLIGTLFTNNYCYFLDGVTGEEIYSRPLNAPVDAIAAIPDIVGDGSMEMVAGGRNGQVYCFSGGLKAPLTADFTADITEGYASLTVQFTDLSTAEDTTITSWAWDFDNDGVIDSEEQHPSWIYHEEGIYTVSLTVSDGENEDTETKEDYITVLPAVLEIGDIKGGLFRVNAEIKNTGDTDLYAVEWSISVEGGILGRINVSAEDTIDVLEVDATETVIAKPIFGLGKITITITANGTEKIAEGRAWLFYITILPE